MKRQYILAHAQDANRGMLAKMINLVYKCISAQWRGKQVKNLFSLCLFVPALVLAESNLTPAQPLQTNPLAQQFAPQNGNSNTQLYVTQFTNPAALQSSSNSTIEPQINSYSAWIKNPSQLLSNDVINRYGVGMQIGF
jgi:hypothetical protein